LCRTYGSPEKSYEAAASYGGRVESGKLKVESGREWEVKKGKLKVESEELKKDKVTTAKACPNETACASKTARQSIDKEQRKGERARKLKAKEKKRNKEININKKVNKNGKKKAKRIRGKP
jgi:hypothetical protein